MSGLRCLRMACRRSMWKTWASVEGWQTHVHSALGHEALDPRRRMLRALALVAVRQGKRTKTAGAAPLRFAGRDELVDHHLRH